MSSLFIAELSSSMLYPDKKKRLCHQKKVRIQGYPMNCTCHWCKLKIIVDPAQNLVALLKLQVRLKKVSFWRRPSGFDDLGNFYTAIDIYLGCRNAAVSQAECCDSKAIKMLRIKSFIQVQKDSNCGLTPFQVGRSLSEWSRGAYRSSDVDENRTG